MALKVVQLSLFRLHLLPIYVSSLLAHFHELGRRLSVVFLILGIHFLKLLITGHYVFHGNPLSLSRDVCLSFLSESCVEFSLSAEIVILFSEPPLLFIKILLPSRCYLITNPMSMHCFSEVFLGFPLFSLQLFDSIFDHHPLHLFFLLDQFGLELLGWVLDLDLLDCLHSHLWQLFRELGQHFTGTNFLTWSWRGASNFIVVENAGAPPVDFT